MRHRSFAVLSVLCVLYVTALAVTPQFWENFSQEDLLQGTLTRVSLGPDGKLSLAPSYDVIYDTNQPYIFSMVRDKAGNIYVGTGHEGKVFKIDPQGKGSLYYQSKELDIFALALDAADTLYVGTSPDGRVYKVTGPNQATEFCNPEDKYIWSMLFDDAGNLYVGTGAKGIIYRVDRSGKKSTFFDSADNHIVCQTREGNGNLLAGTSPGGLVIEITPEGKAFTLLDTPMEEIRSLAVDRFGTIYAVASSAKGLPQRPSGMKETIPPPTTGTLPVMTIQSLANLAGKSAEAKATVSAPGSEKDSAGSRSSVYAITKDGNAETVYTSKDQMVFDVVVRNDGSLLAATGPKGRLLSIDVAKQVTVVTDSPEEEMTRLAPSGDTIWIAGSNQGKIYKLDSQRAQTGTFESKVLDAKTVASWGKITWRTSNPGGGAVELSTRSGNTEKPDNSWSSWSAAYANAAGQQITNPRARYLQWRAVFKRGTSTATGQKTDTLERVQIPYLQQNVRPQVVSINVLPYGMALQKPPALPPGTVSVGMSATATDGLSLNSPRERGKDKQPIPPRQALQPGAQSFTWKATDDNDDNLEYSLFFRGEGESDWKQLEKKLTDAFYTLDAASLPDGVYTLKVVASDEPSNPFGKFLIGELESRPFVISNTTPLIEISNQKVNGKRVEVQFRAKVPTGRIATAEFSIDGGEWYLVFPVDGIADSVQEDFQFTTPELSVGEHLIGLRSSDSNGNTGTAKLLLKIP
jgi:hypothetical protein